MNRMMDIVSEKELLNLERNKLFYIIDKRVLWYTYIKPILKSYKESKLSYQKIEDFIYFLQLSDFKYSTLGYIVKFSVDEYYRTLMIEDSDYKLNIDIYNKDKTVAIEYTVKSSDTRYNYNIYDANMYKNKYNIRNSYNVPFITIDNETCYVNPLDDVINIILNDTIYSLVKDYILRD